VRRAALLQATWNIAAKRAGGDDRFVFITSALTSALWPPAGLWFGWNEVPLWGWAEWGIVTASAAVHLLCFRALITGYRVGDLTVVYPLARGSGPLLTALGAVLLLGERDCDLRLAGTACIAGWVMLLARGGG
jgi:multidrug transporter EmrE-like cation transporter